MVWIRVKTESLKGQSGCFQSDAQIAVVKVLNLEEARIDESGFIDAEGLHDSK
jgi:hypothetical protein